MEKINKWLTSFKTNWENKNVKKVLELFDKNCIYYETPFKKLKDFDELSREWEFILKQEKINLNYEIFSKSDDKYTVIWDLKYIDAENKNKHFKGTYLIKLNNNNLCEYFHHTCESK